MSQVLSIIILICIYSLAIPPLLESQDPVIFTIGILVTIITGSLSYFLFKTLIAEDR